MSKRAAPPEDGATSQEPVRLVVKHTFLELENSGQQQNERATGRRKSDSSVPTQPDGTNEDDNGDGDGDEDPPVQNGRRHGRYNRDSVVSIMTNNGFDGPSEWSSTRPRGSMESGPRGSWQSSSRRSSVSSRPWSGYQEHHYPQPFYSPASGYDATHRVPLSTAPMGPGGPPPPGYGHPPPPHMFYGGYAPDPMYPPMPRHYPHHHHHHHPPLHPGYYPPAMPPPTYGCPYCYPPPPGPGYPPPPMHGHPGPYQQPPPPVYDIREHRPQWLFPDGDQEGSAKRSQRDRDVGRDRDADRNRNKSEGGRQQRTPMLQTSSVGCRTTYTPLKTTVMVRNIPPGYTRNRLTDLLDSKGMSALYDFVYMPMNFRTKASFGYAFVNLVSPEAAEECHTKFNGFKDWGLESDKICEVSWSDMHQGLDAHIERYRNSPVMHTSVPDEYKPVMFNEGKRIEFPPPSKKIRQPRIRRSSDGGLDAGEDDDDEDEQDDDGEDDEQAGDRVHPPPPSTPPPAAPTPPQAS